MDKKKSATKQQKTSIFCEPGLTQGASDTNLAGSDKKIKSDRHDLSVVECPANNDVKTMEEVSGDGGNENKADLAYVQSTLRHYPWYHGMLLSSHVADVLKWDLSFVVRRSGESDASENFFCLSVRQSNRIHHYAFRNDNDGWSCPKLPIPGQEKLSKFEHIHLILEDWSSKVDGVTPVPRSKLILFHDDLKAIKKLGEGAFGEVWKGTVTIDGVTKDCAIKKIKGQVKRVQTDAFFHEAKIMSKFDHECIVKYYGQCTLMNPLVAVMELASGGTVRGYLRHHHKAPVETMIHFVVDIARGMEHISSKRIIHRDLAARNCLIGDNMTVKISDFGLSVIGEEIKIQVLKQAPIRWLAPETLNKGIFNEKTDVWSFGVVIWEIFTNCLHHPLYPKNIKDAQTEIKEVDKPHKFDASNKGSPPKEILTVLEGCTRTKPENRLKFRQVLAELAKGVEKWKKSQPAKIKEKSGRKEKTTQKPIKVSPSQTKMNNSDRSASKLTKKPSVFLFGKNLL